MNEVLHISTYAEKQDMRKYNLTVSIKTICSS